MSNCALFSRSETVDTDHLLTIILIHVGVEIRIGEGFPIPGAECNLFERVSYQWLTKVAWHDFLI